MTSFNNQIHKEQKYFLNVENNKKSLIKDKKIDNHSKHKEFKGFNSPYGMM